MLPMRLMIAIISVAVVIFLMLLYWGKIESFARGANPLGALAGLALLKRKKGIQITTSLLATIVFAVVVIFIVLLILVSLSAEAGQSSSTSFYNTFDVIISWLPWVS